MDPDEHVCLCFRVSLRKIRTYLKVNEPKVPSALCECLDAGTGCGWCVPYLKELHRQHQAGETLTIEGTPEEYASGRQRFKASKRQDG